MYPRFVAVLRCHARAGEEKWEGGQGERGGMIAHRLSRELTNNFKGCWQAAPLVLWQGCAGAQLQDFSIQGAPQPCYRGLHQICRQHWYTAYWSWAGMQQLRIPVLEVSPRGKVHL